MSSFQASAPSQYSEILCDRQLQVVHFNSEEFNNAELIIAIAHKDQEIALIRALKSAFNQTLVKKCIARIVILDDSSNHNWSTELIEQLAHPSITLLKGECGSPARARNLLLDWADNQTKIKWVARLDADDEFFSPESLEGLWSKVRNSENIAVIGSNKLRKNNVVISNDNIANPDELKNRFHLSRFIEDFAFGKQKRELPSCNLILHTRLGLRYPNIRSAEDHWFICRLLMFYQTNVAICPYPIYSIYSLDGKDTKLNITNNVWHDQRERLAYVARTWCSFLAHKRHLLGIGMEGVVWLQHNLVIKEFYPWAINDDEVKRLISLLDGKQLPIPEIRWRKCNGLWQYQTVYVGQSHPQMLIPKHTIINYLTQLYRANISTLNIKRDNLILTPEGDLQYIDIGKDIQPLTTSNYRDMCARLYSIGILGNSDEEFVRRKSWRRQDDALKELIGFESFFGELLSALHPQCIESTNDLICNRSFKTESTTLMIKVCGQDDDVLTDQITHIITQLCYPVTFAEIVILIDPHEGVFLRQYANSNLESVIQQATTLKEKGLADRILIAPTDTKTIETTYFKWFNVLDCKNTHTVSNAPLFPQIWGFDQIKTRYVLQCDLDVLIGRRNWQHDYLADMLYACEPTDVLAVGFNISKSSLDFNPYYGNSGQFAPEVRFGLLDLNRINEQLPIENPISNNQMSLTWHRALQAIMDKRGLRALRGGDPNSYYVHPRNEHKHLPELPYARDLIAQGKEPINQHEQFDWIPGKHWHYPTRNEGIVFLLKGRNTDQKLLKRCLNSLRNQTNQNFGIVLIDDASGSSHNWCYPILLGELQHKTTLIRHGEHKGRMPNFILAIKEICQDPNTLIAVLDQDDCLMQDTIVSTLYKAKHKGADLIQMPMFRPNKPLKLYQPNYINPRQSGGGNVWSHFRVFTKELFERVPESYFKNQDGSEWIDRVTDYLTMLPMVELAKSPRYIDLGYAYWHMRNNYKPEEKEREKILIRELLSKATLGSSEIEFAEQ